MRKELDARIHNRFDIEIIDAKTGKVKQKAFAENIILNQAWAQIVATATDWFTTIFFGTGTGTLSAARTALFTPLASKAAADGYYTSNVDENWCSLRQKITLTETEYNGSVITEVGVGNGTLCTHALLKDMNGNQISLTKVDTDIINIYATVYAKFSGTFSVDNPIEVIRAPSGTGAGWGLIGRILGRSPVAYDNGYNLYGVLAFPAFARALGTNRYSLYGNKNDTYLSTTNTVSVAEKKITLYARFPAADWNIGGVRSVVLYGRCRGDEYHLSYSPVIRVRFPSPTHTQAQIVEQIGTGDGSTVAFATTFPFVKSGAVIKVDGTPASPTVKTGLPNVQDIRDFMRNLGTTGKGELSYIGSAGGFPFGEESVPIIVENPFYANYGIDTIGCSGAKISTSDDGITWTQVYTTTSSDQTYTVAAEHKQKRYWKFEKGTWWNFLINSMNCVALNALKNVVFGAAPATGAAITAEYDTDVAAKDVNHVLDVTVTIQFGEYTP